MNCPKCGQTVHPSDTICMGCGAHLRDRQQPVSPPAAAPDEPWLPRLLRYALIALAVGVLALGGEACNRMATVRQVKASWEREDGVRLSMDSTGRRTMTVSYPKATYTRGKTSAAITMGDFGMPEGMTGSIEVLAAPCLSSKQQALLTKAYASNTESEEKIEAEFEVTKLTPTWRSRVIVSATPRTLKVYSPVGVAGLQAIIVTEGTASGPPLSIVIKKKDVQHLTLQGDFAGEYELTGF